MILETIFFCFAMGAGEYDCNDNKMYIVTSRANDMPSSCWKAMACANWKTSEIWILQNHIHTVIWDKDGNIDNVIWHELRHITCRCTWHE